MSQERTSPHPLITSVSNRLAYLAVVLWTAAMVILGLATGPSFFTICFIVLFYLAYGFLADYHLYGNWTANSYKTAALWVPRILRLTFAPSAIATCASLDTIPAMRRLYPDRQRIALGAGQ